MQFIETGFGEVLAGVGQDEIVVVDAEFFAPARIEERRVDGSHAGDIGISFGGDIETTGTGSFNHRKTFDGVARAGAIDMHDVERSSADRGGTDDLADGFDGGAGLDASGAAHMGVDGKMARGGDSEDVD